MHVGGEEQRNAEHGEEIADNRALLALRRIDRGNEAETQLLRDHVARDLERGNSQPRGNAEHRADENFLNEHHQSRPERPRIDVIGAAMKRQQHGGEDERECQPHARRDILLAQPRQQHQHRAGAREYQEKSGSKRRQVG